MVIGFSVLIRFCESELFVGDRFVLKALFEVVLKLLSLTRKFCSSFLLGSFLML